MGETADPIKPAYYRRGGIEVFDAAEAWGLDQDAYLFTALKYIARAGHKGSEIEDLEKAREYLDRKIKNLKGNA